MAKPQPLCPTIHPPPHLALLWGPADEAGRKPASRRSAEDGSRLPARKWRGLGELCAPGQLPTQKERQGQLSLRQPHHPPRGQIPRLATPPAPGPHLAAAADCLPPRSLDRHTSRHRKDALASLFPQTPKLPPAGCTGDCLTQYLGPWDHATVACLGRPGTGTKSESESEAAAASTGAGRWAEPCRRGGAPPRGWGAGAGETGRRADPAFPGQFSSVAQSCQTLCDPRDRSTPGLPVHHQLPEFIQSHRVGDATPRQGLKKIGRMVQGEPAGRSTPLGMQIIFPALVGRLLGGDSPTD